MPIYVIVMIIVFLSALAGYALVSQSIEKHRAKKQRALMILKTRHRNLMRMISSFPQHFLPDDLINMTYRAAVDICEQLHELEPDNSKYPAEVIEFNSLIKETAETEAPAKKVTISNPQQIKEIRLRLEDLHEFVVQQQTLTLINFAQAEVYKEQIKQLEVQMAVDETPNQAKLAQEGGKLRLAIHYFTLAKKQFVSENANQTFDKQIAQVDAAINKIEAEIAASDDGAPMSEAASKEWDNFNKQDDGWQKKQNYY